VYIRFKLATPQELWKSRQAPTPLQLQQLLPDLGSGGVAAAAAGASAPAAATAAAANGNSGASANGNSGASANGSSGGSGGRILAAAAAASPSAAKGLGLSDQAVWSEAESALVFLTCVVKFLTQRSSEMGAAAFDKVCDRWWSSAR
jgi:hypothetical protein